jgi:Transposase DDE domain
VVAAQAEVGKKTNEVPVATVVLDQIDLEGKVVTADALHTVKATADHIHERGGEFVLPVKENRRALFDALDALPWDQVPDARTSLKPPDGPDASWTGPLPSSASHHDLGTAVGRERGNERKVKGPCSQLPGYSSFSRAFIGALITVPARLPFARRAPAAVPGAERPPASVPGASAEVSSLRHAARWTVRPGSQDDDWLHRCRRHHLSRADRPTTLKRSAIRAAPLDATTTSSPVTAAAPAAGRGSVTRDFSAVPAHRAALSADPLQVPMAAHVERALGSPYARPPVGALEAARRASGPLPDEIRVRTGGLSSSPPRPLASAPSAWARMS